MDPRRVQEGMASLLERLGCGDARVFAAVFGNWEKIAGPAVAAHAKPLRLSTNVLVVGADHSAWATQLRLMSGKILSEITAVAGRAPERLEVVVRGAGFSRFTR